MTTTHVQSFALISMLRGRPKTPPSGDDLAVLDYHLKEVMIEIAPPLIAHLSTSMETNKAVPNKLHGHISQHYMSTEDWQTIWRERKIFFHETDVFP